MNWGRAKEATKAAAPFWALIGINLLAYLADFKLGLALSAGSAVGLVFIAAVCGRNPEGSDPNGA